MSNNYRREFIRKHTWKEKENEEKNPREHMEGEGGAEEVKRKERCIVLPWERGLEKLVNIFKKRDTRVFFKNQMNLGQVLKHPICKKAPKSKEPTDIVYRIPCKAGCESAYIGETSRTLTKRKKEHRSNIRCCDRSSKLAFHSVKFDHNPDWEKACVVYKDVKDWGERTFLEGIVSLREKDPINIYRNIPPVYNSLIKTWKNGERKNKVQVIEIK